MCLNCGCGMPEDDMGNKDNITTEDLAKAAIASKMSAEETLKKMEEGLKLVRKEDLEKEIEKQKNK